MSVPELRSVDLTFTASDEPAGLPGPEDRTATDSDPTLDDLRKWVEKWEAAARPEGPEARAPLVIDPAQGRPGSEKSPRRRAADANEYIVSLDAITSVWATRSEVADRFGLPPDAFYRQRKEYGVAWTCEVEADKTVGLAERVSLLASAVHPRRPHPRFRRNAKIRLVFLDIGVLSAVSRTEACSVSVPVSGLRSLVRNLLVHRVSVTCYPNDLERHGDEEG